MQGIYIYIPETNHVSRVLNVAVNLWLQFMVHIMLRSMVKVFTLTLLVSSSSSSSSSSLSPPPPPPTFMQGIYIPETNHVSRVLKVSTIL
jgi:hypothetical protein